jgi:hypothetical protein
MKSKPFLKDSCLSFVNMFLESLENSSIVIDQKNKVVISAYHIKGTTSIELLQGLYGLIIITRKITNSPYFGSAETKIKFKKSSCKKQPSLVYNKICDKLNMPM